jgi:hypothetical protein
MSIINNISNIENIVKEQSKIKKKINNISKLHIKLKEKICKYEELLCNSDITSNNIINNDSSIWLYGTETEYIKSILEYIDKQVNQDTKKIKKVKQ